MFDHIGPGSQRTCTKMVVSCLVADSLFLLRIIYTSTYPDCRRPRDQQVHFSRWPVAGQIDAAAGGACITGDWQNFGTRYIPTQVAWLTNAEARREELRQLGYDDRFQRMCATFCCRLPVLSARRNRL
jgi:cyclopropane fatty-acyl-phospholipid synthase-like methyltransferase